MISVYAWLRRHPLLVVAMLACALVEMGIGSVIRLGVFWGWLPFTIVMVIAVVLRRRYPVGAFGVAVAAGALQVLTGVHLSGTDLAIVILLYTLAAYGRVRPRSASVPGLVVCLLGAAAAALTWGHPKDVSTGTALLAEAVVLMGPVLIGGRDISGRQRQGEARPRVGEQGRGMRIRTVLVDDQEPVRTGFRMVLDARRRMVLAPFDWCSPAARMWC